MHWFLWPRVDYILLNLSVSGLGELETFPERDINFLKKFEDERSKAAWETNELDDVFIL